MSQIELRYKKALQDYNLKESDLSEDAKIGIKELAKVMQAVSMAENNGRKPSQLVLNKIKAMDKWVFYEIIDQVHDTDKNDDEMPVQAQDVINDIKKDTVEQKIDTKGVAIESELKSLIEAGVSELTLEELKSKAKKTYYATFESYKEGEENGVETSHYRIIESSDKVFKISKI